MSEKTLIAKVHEDEKKRDTLLVKSPVVGMADGAPRSGLFLNPLDRVIAMKILNVRHVLRLPRDVHGRVTEVFIPNSYTPLAYGQPIARLDPRALNAGADENGAAGSATAAAEPQDAGLITIEAPSDGIFYRRPSPDAPPYVEIGSQVSSGGMLGLVEIMKCFHHIVYGGPSLPESGEIVKVMVEDASEVRFGQPLFKIRPSG